MKRQQRQRCSSILTRRAFELTVEELGSASVDPLSFASGLESEESSADGTPADLE